ncbi:MAG TPA: tyrosine-protein phosphatase [Streptosporangiaceae bacterium]
MTWIELDGAVNVRDLGGLPTTDGGKIAEGRLLRSDNLDGLTAADVHRLVTELGLATVVDLRSTQEHAAAPAGPLTAVGSVRHVRFSLLPEMGVLADTPGATMVVRAEQALERCPADIRAGFYLGYLADRPDQVVGALRSVSASPGPALVHCAAGKDRTGVIVAMALSVAGAEPDAISADYAASAERIDAILGRLRGQAAYSEGVEKVTTVDHTPRAETMDAFQATLAAQYGGAEGWLAGHGFGAAEAAALRARLRDG